MAMMSDTSVRANLFSAVGIRTNFSGQQSVIAQIQNHLGLGSLWLFQVLDQLLIDRN